MADFTISDVLAWARTKPADERYDYDDTENCALSQFMRETGVPFDGSVGGTFWLEVDGTYHELDPELADALVEDDACFGALADRLAALIPAEPVSDTWTKADAYLADIEQVSAWAA